MTTLPRYETRRPGFPIGNSLLWSTVSLAGFLGFAVFMVLLDFVQSGYNPVRRFGSEHVRFQYGYLMTTAFVCLAAGMFALAWLLNRLRLAGALPRTGIILIVVLGVDQILSAIFPIDLPESTPTLAGRIHFLLGVLTFLSMGVSTILIGFARGAATQPRAWRLQTRVSGIVILACVPVMFAAVQFGFPGVVQRFILLVFLSWSVMTAWRLRHAAPWQPPRSPP